MSTLRLCLLACAQTIAWACCFYSFAALLPHWEADLGWSRSSLAAAFSQALLLSALLGPFIGHLIDRGRARSVMVSGAIIGAVALAGMATVTELWQFVLCWLILALAQACCLYEACFSFLTRRCGCSAMRAITVVTLFGGFASSLAFPLGHVLVGVGGWRLALGVFAGLMLVVALLYGLCLGSDRPAPEAAKPPAAAETPVGTGIGRRWLLVLLAITFAMMSLNHGGLIAHLLPLLHERSISPTAAVVASSFIGPMQVIGRIALMGLGGRLHPGMAVACSLAATGLAALALICSTMSVFFLVVFVILQGAGYGVLSIARPTLIAHWFGAYRFGVVAGWLAVPHTAGYALAPALGAVLAECGTYDLLIVVAGGYSFCGLVCLCVAARLRLRECPDRMRSTTTAPGL